MARNKNSPALFEVIRNAQQKQKEAAERQRQQELAAEVHAHSPAAGLLMSPIYWFKGKLAHEAANTAPADGAAERAIPVMREVPTKRDAVKRTPPPQPPVVDDAAAPVQDDTYIARSESQTPVVPTVDSAPSADPVIEIPAPIVPTVTPVRAYTPAPTSAVAEAMRQVREDIAAQEAPAAEPAFHDAGYDKSFGRSAFDVDDEPAPARGFQFSYTSAAVAGFAIVIAFGVAYVIGSHNRNQPLANASGTNAVRPEVLNVRSAPVEKPADPEKVEPVVDSRASLNAQSDIALAGIGKPIAVPTDVKRVVGMHYVVLQSFPSDYDAKDLVKYLAQNGVAATAERPLPGYSAKWTSVITVRGFDHVRDNPALEAYKGTLMTVLKKYATEQNGLKKISKVDLYKWKTAAK